MVDTKEPAAQEIKKVCPVFFLPPPVLFDFHGINFCS